MIAFAFTYPGAAFPPKNTTLGIKNYFLSASGVSKIDRYLYIT